MVYDTDVDSPEQTPRQRLIELLTGGRLSSRQLAERLGIPEREVEAHLEHVVRSLSRDRSRQFLLEPAACGGCGFVFRDRRKLTRPSRCPRCRGEGITAPRYGIEPNAKRARATRSHAPSRPAADPPTRMDLES